MKYCTSCKQEKVLLAFHKSKKTKDGYNAHCKDCRKIAYRKYYDLNKEFIQQKNKNYYNENIEVVSKLHRDYRIRNSTLIKLNDHDRDRRIERRFKKSKIQAQKRKLSWNISLEDFRTLCEKDCFYCKNRLDNRLISTSSALDRKDNTIGYEIENVLPSCATCNYLRGDILSIDETIKLISLLIDLRGL